MVINLSGHLFLLIGPSLMYRYYDSATIIIVYLSILYFQSYTSLIEVRSLTIHPLTTISYSYQYIIVS